MAVTRAAGRTRRRTSSDTYNPKRKIDAHPHAHTHNKKCAILRENTTYRKFGLFRQLL